MRRYPNPWVFVPALLGGALGGAIAYALSGCDGPCASGVFWAVVVGFVTALGFGTVAVLADRSIGEWRAAVALGEEPPEPGCEVPDTPDSAGEPAP